MSEHNGSENSTVENAPETVQEQPVESRSDLVATIVAGQSTGKGKASKGRKGVTDAVGKPDENQERLIRQAALIIRVSHLPWGLRMKALGEILADLHEVNHDIVAAEIKAVHEDLLAQLDPLTGEAGISLYNQQWETLAGFRSGKSDLLKAIVKSKEKKAEQRENAGKSNGKATVKKICE